MALTRHERLARLFRGQEVDRPAIKLWALREGQALLHPDYRPVYELGMRTTELFDGGSCPFDCVLGAGSRVGREQHAVSDEWDQLTTTLDVGGRVLRRVDLVSRVGKPGYAMEHFVKEGADLEAILALPFAPYPADLASYERAVMRVGEAGLALYGLPHPAYALYELMGSEALAMMTLEARELLDRAVSLFSDRLLAHVRRLLDAGLSKAGGLLAFAWVGPELFLPPLLSPADFDQFCFAPDKRLIDLIHDAGGYAWIHCHGKVRDFIDRFARMGCDMLNPIEPPPMGDLSLREAFSLAGGRMALEGNIEIGDIMTASPDYIRFLVDRALNECENRFVLGLTTGYMEVPTPPARMIENELLFLRYGYERLEAMRR
ncbi:MAG: hypothetical protein GX558_07360 [Clostridiales bacterium]|nr:hypothetical protein [Clostridiales bacterium]